MFLDFIKKLIEKYKSFLAYAVFGILTTVVNILVYYMAYNFLNLSNVISTILAWFLAVIFAFITNKLWVFDSKLFKIKVILYELSTFFLCRIMTGILDVGIMWLCVDVLSQNAIFWKIISNIIVIILNFVASKCFIFVKKGDSK